MTALSDLDQGILRALRTRGHGPLTDTAMKALGRGGEWGAVWISIGLVAAVADPARRGRWLRATAVAPVAIAINFAIKRGVGRRRPLIADHPPLARAPSKLSFPSAHATSSVAAAVALGRIEPRARPHLRALATGICGSRPYLGMHYPSDVLAGAALGAALGRLAPGLDRTEPEERLIDLVVSANGGGGAE